MVITSFLLSAEAARSVLEEICLPRRLWNSIIQSFAPMEHTRTAVAAQENVTGSGDRIRRIELLRRSAPITRMMAATASPAKYSMRE